ncbi:MAG: hypothetical protein OXC46_05350 [Thaumarchaeota archaeon]|nr:hypothetical protein [Nitrososphaerota archaeon]
MLGCTKDTRVYHTHNIKRYKNTTYYTPKPILKMLKNPKRLNFISQDGHIKVAGSN